MMPATRVLWVVHLVGNLALAGLFWLWLGIPDARTWQLGLTAILGLVIIGGLLWLHGSTFRYFGESASALAPVFRESLRRLPLFAIWTAVFVLSIVLLQRWQPASGAGVTVHWLLAWIVMPAVLLPGAAAAMGRGRGALDVYRSPKYWIWAALLMVVGVYLPWRLVLWTPGLKGFSAEAASFAVRWTFGYLAAVTAWLMLAYVSSGGIPRFTQLKTLSLPYRRMHSETSA
jgi:hypothetical protein